MISEAVYQNIYEELSRYLMPGWKKLVVYLEYGNASYSFSFFIQNSNEYVKCYNLPNVSDEELVKSFSKIDKIVSTERKKVDETWSNMTMVVDNTGSMHTDFDYTDLSQGNYQYKKDWKKKYLV